MKKILLPVIFLASTLSAQTNNKPIISTIDGYAARVNNRIITYGEIRKAISPIIPRLAQAYQGDELAEKVRELYLQGRETLVEEALIKEEARVKGLTLPPEMIQREMDAIIQDKFNQDRSLFNKVLATRRMTLEEWKKEMSDRLVMRAYYSQEVLRKIKITDEEILAEYEQIKEKLFIPFRVKYHYILINKGTTEEEQTVKREQAKKVLQKLRDGADFAALAEEVSEGDPALSPWRDPVDVKAPLRPALRQTPAGQFSDLIETDSVFYIVGVESRQEEGYTPLDEVRASVTESLAAQKRERLHHQLMERLRAKHYIERYD